MKIRLWRSRYSQWGQSQPGVEVWQCCRPQAGLSRWNLRPTRWGNIEVSISFSISTIIFTKIRFRWIPSRCRQLRCKRMFAHCDTLNYFDHCAALHAFLCQLFHHVMQRWSEADSLMVTQASGTRTNDKRTVAGSGNGSRSTISSRSWSKSTSWRRKRRGSLVFTPSPSPLHTLAGRLLHVFWEIFVVARPCCRDAANLIMLFWWPAEGWYKEVSGRQKS